MGFLRVVREGDWATFPATMRKARDSIGEAARVETEKLARSVRDYLVDGVRSQRLRLPALLPSYTSQKRADGFGDQPILVRTGGYLGAVQVIRDGVEYRVGFLPGAAAEDGTPYERIALSLEFGSSRMVSRPHWRPAAEHASRGVRAAGKAVVDVLRLHR